MQLHPTPLNNVSFRESSTYIFSLDTHQEAYKDGYHYYYFVAGETQLSRVMRKEESDSFSKGIDVLSPGSSLTPSATQLVPESMHISYLRLISH